jgi:hypothetical protein
MGIPSTVHLVTLRQRIHEECPEPIKEHSGHPLWLMLRGLSRLFDLFPGRCPFCGGIVGIDLSRLFSSPSVLERSFVVHVQGLQHCLGEFRTFGSLLRVKMCGTREHCMVSCRGHFSNSDTLEKAQSAGTPRAFWGRSERFLRVCEE